MLWSIHTKGPLAACKILAILLAGALPVRAADGPVYDVFAKALAPFSSAVFGGGQGQPGAMVAECLVAGGSGPLAAAKGTRFRLALQAPDRLRVDVVREGTRLTACRNGKELWAVPAEPMRALASQAGIDVGKTAPDESAPPLVPLALDAQMLTFLPVVFDVKDLGTETDPSPRRVLEFGLLPELRQMIKAEEFTGKAWIGEDYKPSRLVITTPAYSVEIEIEKLGFAEKLDPAAWQPAEGEDAMRLPASALNELFEKMLGR